MILSKENVIMNHMKRLAAFLLAAIMVFSLLPTTAMATEDGATPVCSGEATGCTGDVHVHPCPLYVAPGCTECGQTEGHADTCTVPCTMQGNCTSAAHKEGCMSQIVCDTCGEKGGSHKADCTVPCTGEAGCTSAAHKEGCKSLYCEHDVLKTETCGECSASAARIKAVQDLIDALPSTVTNDDEAAALEAAFTAIDAAKVSLVGDEINSLKLDNWNAAMSAYDTYKKQPGASVPKYAWEKPDALKLGAAYITKNGNDWRIWGEVSGVTGDTQTFVAEVYTETGDTPIATSTLKKPIGETVSWHLRIAGSSDEEYWSYNWLQALNPEVVPARVKFIINDVDCGFIPITYDHEAQPDRPTWAEWFVAKVGNTYYTSLQDAIENANGAEVTLLTDVTEKISTTKDFKLNLNQKTIYGKIYGKGTFEVSNGTVDTNGAAEDAIRVDGENGGSATMTLTNVTAISHRHTVRVAFGTATINSGTYTTKGTGTMHAVYATEGSSVTIKNGAFIGAKPAGSTDDSAAVAIKDGSTLVIQDGDFSGGTAYTLNLWSGTATISGGTYDQDPYTRNDTGKEILSDGKAVKNNGNGTYTIVDAVAKIGTKGYAALQAAFDAATEGQTVTLMADLDLAAPAVAPAGKAIILDLNGKTITNTTPIWTSANNALIQVNGKLTINDSVGTGKVHALANDCYAADLKDGGELIINGGSYLGNWSTVYVRKSTLVINGGHFDMTQPDDNGTKGHMINAKDVDYNSQDAHITINGGSFVGFNPSNNIAETGGHTNFAKEGYAGKATNGVYTLVPAAAVNTSTGAAYATFAEALADVGTGETIKLLKDVTENFTLTKSVTLNLDGKKLAGTANINSDQIQLTIAAPSNNTLIQLASTATKAGYALGWQKDGTAITGSTVNAAGVYAIKWNANTYSIRYNLNGGALAAGVTNPTSYTTDTPSFTLNNPVRTGYTFKGWTANETFFAPTATVTIAQGSTKNYSFFANWEANKYDLVFSGNGGTTSSGDTTVLTAPQPAYDTQIVLPVNPFTHPNSKYFVGWNTAANGSGTTYAPGAVLSGLATGVEGDATYTLYAKWADKPAPQFSITEASKETTYNGKPQGISFSTNADTSKITITYTLANAKTRVTSNNPTNAGTYDVTVSIDDPNFTAATYSFPGAFTIKKAPLKVYYQSETIYAGHAPKWVMVMEGFVNGETHAVLTKVPQLPAVKPTALGTHEIWPYGGEDDNYEIIHEKGLLIIKEKVIYVYSPDKLLQTGEAAWLIPVLAACGLALMAAGVWFSRKKKSYEQ